MPPQTISQNEFEKSDEFPDTVESYEEQVDSSRAVQEYLGELKLKLQSTLETSVVVGKRGERLPDLSELPQLVELFSTLGLDEQQYLAIFSSWTSFNGLKKVAYEGDKINLPHMKRDSIREAMHVEYKMMQREIVAITEYAKMYNKAELQAIISIFGIHHFSRYTPEMLHGQLEAWMRGDLPEHVVVSAKSDWNGALSNEGPDNTFVITGEQVFFFEAGSGKEIADIAVQIGNRERESGRVPEKDSPVKYFVIHAHANSSGMLLSDSEEGKVLVEDYERSAIQRSKIGAENNNYRRHLGSEAKIILRGCSTAADNKDGPNIATTISDEHDMFVEAAKFPTMGMSIVDDNVKFTVSKPRWFFGKREVKGLEEGVELDGRGGDGVLER